MSHKSFNFWLLVTFVHVESHLEKMKSWNFHYFVASCDGILYSESENIFESIMCILVKQLFKHNHEITTFYGFLDLVFDAHNYSSVLFNSNNSHRWAEWKREMKEMNKRSLLRRFIV